MAIEPVIYGLSAALFWGSGDFFSRQPSQRIGYYMTSSLVQLFGFLGLSAYLLLTGGMDSSLMFSHPSYLIINLLVVGVGMFVALLFLYRGYATGIMSIAAPVAGSYPIVTILLSAAILGEIVTGLRAIGILVVIIGIIIAGIKISELRSLSGISKTVICQLRTKNR